MIDQGAQSIGSALAAPLAKAFSSTLTGSRLILCGICQVLLRPLFSLLTPCCLGGCAQYEDRVLSVVHRQPEFGRIA